MLWYGFFYYLCFLFLIFIILIYFLRMYIVQTFYAFDMYLFIVQYVINFFLFFLFLALFNIYLLYEYTPLFSQYGFSIFFFNWTAPTMLYNIDAVAHNLLFVYYFPFIYIFIIITVLSIIYCLAYNINELNNFLFYTLLILFFGYCLFATDSLILFFLAYEMLLIPSFFILYRFAKTRRSIEAAYLMFFWTQFGAFFLIFSFLYLFFITNTSSFTILSYFTFSNFEVNFLFICWIIGFGVKLPIWPFYGWLPRAHVEASTNFSIFLSGVLVKFAFFGLFKCLLTMQLEPTFILVYPFLILGIVDSVFKLFYQIDLKKLVAYSTVVEMHWLTIAIINGQSGLFLAGFCMLISHAFLSTNSFLLVDAINRRFKTRLITEVSGINFLAPKLFIVILANSLVFLGFPGSIFFIAEVLFFSFLFDLFPLLALGLVVLLYLLGPTFFFRNWISVMFGLSTNIQRKLPLDLDSREIILYYGLILIMFWLGFTWQAFLF